MGNYNAMNKTGSSTTAKVGLGLAIGAGAVALSNANNGCNRGCNNGGLLSGLFGGNCNNDCYVDEKEFAWAQAYNTAQAELAKEKSERYADSVGLGVYEQLVAERKEIDQAQNDGFRFLNEIISDQKSEIAVLKSDVRCLAAVNDKEHEAIVDGYKAGIQLEAERRACGDEKLKCYVDANFIPGTLKLDIDDICPAVQPKCPDVQLVELVSTAVAQALAIGATSAKATAK